LKPKPKAAQYVVALYDFDAQADGDLSFKTGDRIEIVEKTASSEDWWTGKLNGTQGVFPGGFLGNAFVVLFCADDFCFQVIMYRRLERWW
jgi:amphiphysin